MHQKDLFATLVDQLQPKAQGGTGWEFGRWQKLRGRVPCDWKQQSWSLRKSQTANMAVEMTWPDNCKLQTLLSTTQANCVFLSPSQPHSVSQGALAFKHLLAPCKQGGSTSTFHWRAKLFHLFTLVVKFRKSLKNTDIFSLSTSRAGKFFWHQCWMWNVLWMLLWSTGKLWQVQRRFCREQTKKQPSSKEKLGRRVCCYLS